jgi:hypothetical protein
MDDRVLIYRGADQPDLSVINPESDVWQHIKVCIHVQVQMKANSLHIGPTKIPGLELAYPILFSQQ